MAAPDENNVIYWFPGAVDLLRFAPARGRSFGRPSEPAQVVECPACKTLLAVAHAGLTAGAYRLHLVLQAPQGTTAPAAAALSTPRFNVAEVNLLHHPTATFFTLSVVFQTPGATAQEVNEWYATTVAPSLVPAGAGVELQSACAARPGYFVRSYRGRNRRPHDFDFDVICPNPGCELANAEWSEKVPLPMDAQPTSGQRDRSFQQVHEAFQIPGSGCRRASRIPIPAYTVDDQVYRHCPSMIVGTVDKFARLAYESEAATMFGHVECYHARSGYYRVGAPPAGKSGTTAGHPTNPRLSRAVRPFDPPSLIIQDELHLVEGALGSMVGLYETVVEKLCERTDAAGQRVRPKYIASTATVRQAEEQVRSIFDRRVAHFPPPGLDAHDSFFSRGREVHPLEAVRAGRTYVGICAPAWGALTPIVRVWGRLLQAPWDRRRLGVPDVELDPFWTLVGYFNAIRELAGAVALYRQDIVQHLQQIATAVPRSLRQDDPLELSSRKSDPMSLPRLLDMLDVPVQEQACVDAVVATSMFGTGVDVTRLGLMVVHGQPKTSSAYIQATGRVGRGGGGLVVTLLRAPRVRDLAHYEFFTAYHRQLYRHVEPITVAPFSPRARERALGPLCVALLRQGSDVSGNPIDPAWRIQHRQPPNPGVTCQAARMGASRTDAEVMALPAVFESRAASQPPSRRPRQGDTEAETSGWLDKWATDVRRLGGQQQLLYHESTMLRRARNCVVLGDLAHQRMVPVVVYENAPNSLREVEATTTFKT